jgi:gamma-glutamyltranspeptidase/glutathione hydrolase
MPRLHFLAGMVAALVVTACSSGGPTYDPNRGLIMDSSQARSTSSGSSSGSGLSLGRLFGPSDSAGAGYAVGDEPYAVKAGAAVLAQGGSAADAATAMYFTLAVTYPVSAGLGGGGLCVVYDAASGRSRAIDFLARNTAGGGAFAVPGNVRGMAALHDEFGTLPWARDVAYGEALAAAGFPVSSALAARLRAAQNVVRLDAGLAAEFLDESGQVKPVGTIVSNRALSETLDAIRRHGSASFYRGRVADRIVTYSTREGGTISNADLAAYRVGLRDAQTMDIGSLRAYLPPASVGAGSFAKALLSRLVGADGTVAAANPAAATRRAELAALNRFGVRNLPKDLGATGFAARDRRGQGVACAVTMNGPFGSGHTAQGTGVTLANAPAAGRTGLAAAFLTPLLVTKDMSGPVVLPGEEGSRAVALAGAGAGGPNGTAAIAYALLRMAMGEDMTKPGDVRAAGATAYDTVNAIVCQHGICAVLPDPYAHGLGATAGG